MKIFGSYDPIRPDRPVSPVSPVAPAAPPGQPAPSPVAPAPRADSVQLSDSGRSMARQVAGDAGAALDPERTAELRRKVLEGAYNSLEMVDEVARRILRRNDL
jgi:negative regulator of flagellin synthesis FlgM